MRVSFLGLKNSKIGRGRELRMGAVVLGDERGLGFYGGSMAVKMRSSEGV